MKRNYHTHSELCGHGTGKLEDYVVEAIRNGFDVLGLSEHIPYPGDAFRGGGSMPERMQYDCMKKYIDTCKELRDRYRGRIKILIGFETEYARHFLRYYESVLKSGDIDYFILGQHFTEVAPWKYTYCFRTMQHTSDYVAYAKDCMTGMATGMYSYLAHPDLFLRNDLGLDDNVKRATDIIIEGALRNDYVLEVNANGFRRGIKNFIEGPRYPYPTDYFWNQISQTDIRVIIGSDCHNPSFVYDQAVKQTEKFVTDKKLYLVDEISYL